MFKPIHAITMAVPFRATAAPRFPIGGSVRRHADARPRPTLQAHWVRVLPVDGVPRLELRWDVAGSATMRDPDAPIPALAFAA